MHSAEILNFMWLKAGLNLARYLNLNGGEKLMNKVLIMQNLIMLRDINKFN